MTGETLMQVARDSYMRLPARTAPPPLGERHDPSHQVRAWSFPSGPVHHLAQGLSADPSNRFEVLNIFWESAVMN
jgi:hypothetical protein